MFRRSTPEYAEIYFPPWSTVQAEWMLHFMRTQRHYGWDRIAQAWEMDNVTPAAAQARFDALAAKEGEFNRQKNLTYAQQREAWQENAEKTLDRAVARRDQGIQWARSKQPHKGWEKTKKEAAATVPKGKDTPVVDRTLQNAGVAAPRPIRRGGSKAASSSEIQPRPIMASATTDSFSSVGTTATTATPASMASTATVATTATAETTATATRPKKGKKSVSLNSSVLVIENEIGDEENPFVVNDKNKLKLKKQKLAPAAPNGPSAREKRKDLEREQKMRRRAEKPKPRPGDAYGKAQWGKASLQDEAEEKAMEKAEAAAAVAAAGGGKEGGRTSPSPSPSLRKQTQGNQQQPVKTGGKSARQKAVVVDDRNGPRPKFGGGRATSLNLHAT